MATRFWRREARERLRVRFSSKSEETQSSKSEETLLSGRVKA